MISKEQSLANFITNIDDLINSNYILADKKLSIMLKGVSSSKMFIELFGHCLNGFNFEEAKNKSLLSGATYGTGGFSMPTDSRYIIAFVFYLLCEIDQKRVDFLKLLENYFNAGSFKESYVRFSKEVLVPFKNEVVHAVRQMLEGAPKMDATKVVVQKAEKPVLEPEESAKIKNLLNESKAIILQYKMEAKLKGELLTLYDDFSSCIYGTDAERLKVSFLGYKYSTLYHRKLDVSVGEIEKILSARGILEDYE